MKAYIKNYMLLFAINLKYFYDFCKKNAKIVKISILFANLAI